MPYYQRTWNVILGEQAPRTRKTIRTLPAAGNDSKTGLANAAAELPPPRDLNMDKDALKEAQVTLSQQVHLLQTTPGALVMKAADNSYIVDRRKVLFPGLYSTIHLCTNPTLFGESLMIARQFTPASLLKPDDNYFKFLRRIGKENPCIIATLDIFVDAANQIYLFQEYASGGNGLEYLKAGKKVSEPELRYFATSLYDAMDYLGSMGICHRAICPKHIMLCETPLGPMPLSAKLSGFRDAIIYWDPVSRDIIDEPCKEAKLMKLNFFQAPEVFGAPGEHFNPVEADVFSLGVTLFIFISTNYPFNPSSVPEHGVDTEIRNSLIACSALSDGAKYWLYGLMRTNAKSRTEFDLIPVDPWFTGAPNAEGNVATAI